MYAREIVFIFLILSKEIFANPRDLHPRQKRCIVVQKQSGTHGDSSEDGGGDDEDYKKPQVKDPRPDRMVDDGSQEKEDFENITPHFMKYKMFPLKKHFNKIGIRNKAPIRWSNKSWSLKQKR